MAHARRLVLAALLVGALANAAVPPAAQTEARAWRMDPAGSRLTFTPRLAGGEFEGRFERFEATVHFDPADLAHSRLQVTVDLLSARTGDTDRDSALQGADFFATAQWPKAHFATSAIRALGGNRYEARGKLTLRDVTQDVSLPFRFDVDAPQGSSAQLSGATTVLRLPFGVGQGDWRSTEWLDDRVRVQFRLTLNAVR